MWGMDADDLRSLSRVLTFGTPATRRALAERIAADPNPELPRLLMETVRSSEPIEVRERSLEILGIMAAAGNRPASDVLSELAPTS
jgi:hypothetical protein